MDRKSNSERNYRDKCMVIKKQNFEQAWQDQVNQLDNNMFETIYKGQYNEEFVPKPSFVVRDSPPMNIT